jgi:hypothetical protein
MRTIALTHVERRLHETLIAHVVAQCSHFTDKKVEVIACRSR